MRIKFTKDDELRADMRNKLQTPKTALELLSQGKNVPKKFIETALKELSKATRLLKDLG